MVLLPLIIIQKAFQQFAHYLQQGILMAFEVVDRFFEVAFELFSLRIFYLIYEIFVRFHKLILQIFPDIFQILLH